MKCPCPSTTNLVTVVECPLPYASHICLKISTSAFGTMGMCRQIQAYVDEFLAMVTEDVVHGVYKVCDSVIFSV